MPLSLAEQMALDILRGDYASARALCDLLMEDWRDGAREVVPVKRLSVDASRVRVIVYAKDDAEWGDVQAIRDDIRKWLYDGKPLLLNGIDRVEVYELGK